MCFNQNMFEASEHMYSRSLHVELKNDFSPPKMYTYLDSVRALSCVTHLLCLLHIS